MRSLGWLYLSVLLLFFAFLPEVAQGEDDGWEEYNSDSSLDEPEDYVDEDESSQEKKRKRKKEKYDDSPLPRGFLLGGSSVVASGCGLGMGFVLGGCCGTPVASLFAIALFWGMAFTEFVLEGGDWSSEQMVPVLVAGGIGTVIAAIAPVVALGSGVVIGRALGNTVTAGAFGAGVGGGATLLVGGVAAAVAYMVLDPGEE